MVVVLVLAVPNVSAAQHQESHRQGGTSAAAAAERQLWTCGMHPQVVQDHPGDCPICHMELTPLDLDQGHEESSEGTVTIDPTIVQNMGLRTVVAIEGPVEREIRVAGFVEEAQPLIHDVALRVSGWVEKLHAHTEGLHVHAGDVLFDLYSPELQVGVEELIAATRQIEQGARGLEAVRDSARRKLALQGLDASDIERLSRLPQAPRTIAFRSPLAGHVTVKPIVEGSYVEAGTVAMRIVDHSTLWIDARVFEKDLALVSIGSRVHATVAAQAGKQFEGEVVFIHPHLDPTTRTAMVRTAVANPDLELMPGMFATVRIQAELSPRAVLVPREAVIDTGDKQIAFVVTEPGRFEPRRVASGQNARGGMLEIREGIAAGDRVVVSGQFLLDAESRTQEALRKFLREGGAAPGHRH